MADSVNIDSLSIQMDVDFKKAKKSIGDLAKRIDKLNVSMQGLSSANNVLNTFRQIDATMQTIAATSTELNKSVKQLNSAFNKMIPSGGIKNADALKNSFGKLTESLEKAGGGKIKTFATHTKTLNMHLPRLGLSAGKATMKIEGLGRAFTKAIVGARALIAGAKTLWRVLSGGIDLASDLTEVQNVVDKAFGNEAGKIQDLVQSSIQDLGMSELTAKQIASRYQAMGSAMGISRDQVKKASEQIGELRENYNGAGESMADMSINLTKLSADMASFYNVGIEDVAQDLTAIFTGQTRPLRQYGLDLTQATLQEWALKQGIEADVTAMSQAEKTMLRYQYVMSQTKMVQGDFIDTSSSWANQIKILKQQFEALGAVIGGGLINAIKPFVMAMNSALKGIISFAEQVVNALGKIFGWVIEITPTDMAIDDAMVDVLEDQESGLGDVADAADDTAKSIEKAKEAEEEYQRTVLGFDELNKLNKEKEKEEKDPTSPSSGNSAIANPLKNLDLGKASAGAGEVAMSIKKVKSLYESEIDSLSELGGYISDTLTKALNSINWKDVYEGARGFGTGLASFLNGLITPDLFGALGKTIANSLNTALEFLNSFGNEFDFKNFGKALKSGLDELLKNFNWGLAKETARTWAKGMAEGLNEIINPETFSEIGRTIGEGLNTALAFLDEFAYTFDFKNLGKSIETGLNTLMETVDWKTAYSAADGWGTGLAEFLNSLITPTLFDNIGTTVANTLNTALHFLDSFGTTFNWANFGTSLATGVNSFLDDFDWTLLGKSTNTWVNGVFTSIQEFLSKVSWDKLFDGVKTTLSQISFAEVGTNIIATLWSGISNSAMPDDKRQKVLESFSGLESTLRNIANFTFTGLETFYANVLKPLAEWILSDGVAAFANIVTNQFSNVDWGALGTGIANLATALKEFTQGAFEGFIGFFEDLTAFPLIGLLLNSIGNGLNTLFGSLDGKDYSTIKNVGDAVGSLLAAVVAAKLTSTVVSAIKGLAGSAALPALMTAIVTHPAASIIAGGAAIALAIVGFGKAFGTYFDSEKVKQAKELATQVDGISKTLSETKIANDSDYSKIKETLDSFWALNEQMITGGGLTDGEMALFETYKQALMSYSGAIEQELGKVTGAYEGSRTTLEQLINKQYEEISVLAYESAIQEYADSYSEAQKQIIGAKTELIQFLLNDKEVQRQTGYSEENVRALASAFEQGNFSLAGLTEEQQLFYSAIYALSGGVENAQGKLDEFRGCVETNRQTMDTAKKMIDETKRSQDEFTESLKTTSGEAANASSSVETSMSHISDVVDNNGNVIIPGLLNNAAKLWHDVTKKAGDDMAGDIQNGMTGMETAVETGSQNINTDFSEMSAGISSTLGATATNANTEGSALMHEYSKGVTDNQGEVDEAVDAVTSSTDEKLSQAGKKAITRGEEIGNGVVEGLNGTIDSVEKAGDYWTSHALDSMNPRGGSGGGGNAVGKYNSYNSLLDGYDLLITKDLYGRVDNAFGMSNGMSTEMAKRGEAAIKGLEDGATTEEPNLFQKFLDLPKTLTEKLGKVKETFSPYGEDTINGMETGEKNTVSSLETIFMKLPTRLGHQMTDLQSTFERIGENIINYIKNGIGGVEKNLYDKITEIKDALDDPFDQAHYNKWWGIGHDTMDTMWHGLENMRLTLVQEITLIKDSLFTPFGQDVYNRFWRIGHDLMDSLKNGMAAVHIPIPHYTVSEIFGGIVGGKRVNVPSINVNWYKSGGMAYGPSVIGVGEAGNEAVLPLENQGVMAEIAGAIVSGMIDSGALANAVTRGMVAAGQNNDRPVVVNATLRTENDEILARAVARGQRQLDYRMNPVAQI